jgi:hypothetical protein
MIILHYLYVVMVALLFILGGGEEGICNDCINIVCLQCWCSYSFWGEGFIIIFSLIVTAFISF